MLRLSLADLPGIAFVLDAHLRVVELNTAAAVALGVERGAPLASAQPPFDELALQAPGEQAAPDPAGAAVRDMLLDGGHYATSRALADGSTVVLVLDVSPELDRHVRNLAGGFVHELRNVGFGLVVMADMLGGNPENREALRHARASIARLTAATDTLQELTPTLEGAGEELDLAMIVDAAAERAWPPGSRRRLVRSGLSPCPAWGQPELLVRAVRVVLDDVAAHSPKAEVIAADVRRGARAGRATMEVVVRPVGADLPVRDLTKIAWDAAVARRGAVLGPGLALARRWMRSQGGRLAARRAPDGTVEMTIEVPVRGES